MIWCVNTLQTLAPDCKLGHTNRFEYNSLLVCSRMLYIHFVLKKVKVNNAKACCYQLQSYFCFFFFCYSVIDTCRLLIVWLTNCCCLVNYFFFNCTTFFQCFWYRTCFVWCFLFGWQFWIFHTLYYITPNKTFTL